MCVCVCVRARAIFLDDAVCIFFIATYFLELFWLFRCHRYYFNLLLLKIPVTYIVRSYLLTAWSRVLREKLTGSQRVKKFPALYGTRIFITAFTSARHLSLS